MANAACARLQGHDLVGANIVRRFLADPAARDAVVNWAEVAWAGLDRNTPRAGPGTPRCSRLSPESKRPGPPGP